MSDRVTPRTVWDAMREMYPRDVLVQCAKISVALTLTLGFAYGSLLLYFWILTNGEWHYAAAGVALLVTSAFLGLLLAVGKSIEWLVGWVRRR